jgi:hypothetical protein
VGGYVPEIGEVVARDVTDMGDVLVVDQLVRPIVRISVVDEWHPERESRADARKRLRRLADQQIRAELDRLQLDAEAKGYRFVDHAENVERDIGWLFELMANGMTVESLAARDAPDADTDLAPRIGQAINRIAERAGVEVRGWRLPRS